MGKNKNKRKHTEKSDPQESEEKTNKEQVIKESSETESRSQDRNGSEKKKLKKEIQSDQQLIDDEHKESKLEECSDGNGDNIEVHISEEKQKKKKKKNKLKESRNEKNEQNSEEEFRVFSFGQTLTARVTRVLDRTELRLSRRVDDTSDTSIDLSDKEWKALLEVMLKINEFTNDNNNDD